MCQRNECLSLVLADQQAEFSYSYFYFLSGQDTFQLIFQSFCGSLSFFSSKVQCEDDLNQMKI